jgi:hypothetical protein
MKSAPERMETSRQTRNTDLRIRGRHTRNRYLRIMMMIIPTSFLTGIMKHKKK